MQPFTVHTGRVAALPRANVDTDQIIPKQFLKRIERTGFGPALFYDWRYLPDGSPDPAFELNAPKARGRDASWSRGRTSAAARRASTRPGRWRDYGFRAVIAPSFADIFYGNCCQNGLLPVTLLESGGAELLRAARRGARRLRAHGGPAEPPRCATRRGFEAAFDMDPYRRRDAARGPGRDRPHAAAGTSDRRVRAAHGSTGEVGMTRYRIAVLAGRRHRSRGHRGGGAGPARRRRIASATGSSTASTPSARPASRRPGDSLPARHARRRRVAGRRGAARRGRRSLDWRSRRGKRRPEAGLLALRKLLGVYANLRPVAVHPALRARLAAPARAARRASTSSSCGS